MGYELNSQSGGSNGLTTDLTYNQAADVTLFPYRWVPSNARIHTTGFSFNVHGKVGWAGGNYIYCKDSAGGLVAYAPLIALSPFKVINFPTAGCSAYPNVKAVVSYVSSTGVITMASSSLTTTTLAGVPVTVIGGTGKGQSGIIASNTATTITLVTPFPVALDSTSEIGIAYYAATASTGTTVTDSKAVWTSGQFTDGGWYAVVITGTGAGQVRSITSNTGTALTVPTWTTNPSAGDLICVTQNPELMGSVCPAVQYGWTIGCGLGAGLVLGINGTFTGSTSSPIRATVNGFFGL
jgi:hypothetical protein